MRIKFFNSKTGKVKSEKGFTLVELIFVTVVTGILSSSLMLPLLNSMKQGTRPEIYATATYLAEKEIEELKNGGYTLVTGNMGNVPSVCYVEERALPILKTPLENMFLIQAVLTSTLLHLQNT